MDQCALLMIEGPGAAVVAGELHLRYHSPQAPRSFSGGVHAGALPRRVPMRLPICPPSRLPP